MPGIASAATAVALAFVGAQTSTIRIGAGGVMLPNHAPLIGRRAVRNFEVTVSGAGRSRARTGAGNRPGRGLCDAAQHDADENQFPNDVVELMGYFRGENGRVRAIPGEGLNIPI